MNDAATAVEVQEAPVTPAPAKRTCSEETRQKLREKGKARWDAKRAAKASAIPGKTKGMTMAVQILETQKVTVKADYDQRVASAKAEFDALKAERDEVVGSFDELIADAKAKALAK